MIADWKSQAEKFVRQHWAGGIGNPNVKAENILDVVNDIYRAATESGPSWQPRATLEWGDDYVLWISGSGKGSLLWTPHGCWGFSQETTEDLTPWATSGIFQIPAHIPVSGIYWNNSDHPAIHWGNFLLFHSAAWRQNHPEWFQAARKEQAEFW